MESSMPEPDPAPAPAAPPPHPAPGPAPVPVHDGPPGLARVAALAAIAGLLAGAVAFLAGEAYHDIYQPSEEASRQAYDFTELNRQKKAAEAWNGALTYGVLGAALGLAFGAAGGLARRPGRVLIGPAAVGLILGGLAGAGPALGLVPIHYVHKDPASTDLSFPLMIHAGLWVPVGLAAGLAFGLARRSGGPGDAIRCAVGGALGALFGTLAFELLGGIAFPLARTTQPIPVEWPARLLAHGAVALGTALGVSVIGRPGRRPTAARP